MHKTATVKAAAVFSFNVLPELQSLRSVINAVRLLNQSLLFKPLNVF